MLEPMIPRYSLSTDMLALGCQYPPENSTWYFSPRVVSACGVASLREDCAAAGVALKTSAATRAPYKRRAGVLNMRTNLHRKWVVPLGRQTQDSTSGTTAAFPEQIPLIRPSCP